MRICTRTKVLWLLAEFRFSEGKTLPDKRQHRGAHPDDARDFASERHCELREATFEHSWLLERGYSERAALKLVGDKHQLTGRQREAVVRGACSDQARAQRLVAPGSAD